MSYLQTKNQYITVEGLKIAYRELGQGKSQYPLVMLVHLAATMDNWDPKLIDNLAEKNHIIVMDLPGVGASEGEIAESIPCMADQAIAISRRWVTKNSISLVFPWAALSPKKLSDLMPILSIP